MGSPCSRGVGGVPHIRAPGYPNFFHHSLQQLETSPWAPSGHWCPPTLVLALFPLSVLVGLMGGLLLGVQCGLASFAPTSWAYQWDVSVKRKDGPSEPHPPAPSHSSGKRGKGTMELTSPHLQPPKFMQLGRSQARCGVPQSEHLGPNGNPGPQTPPEDQ